MRNKLVMVMVMVMEKVLKKVEVKDQNQAKKVIKMLLQINDNLLTCIFYYNS